jgi:hypothetical protein
VGRVNILGVGSRHDVERRLWLAVSEVGMVLLAGGSGIQDSRGVHLPARCRVKPAWRSLGSEGRGGGAIHGITVYAVSRVPGNLGGLPKASSGGEGRTITADPPPQKVLAESGAFRNRYPGEQPNGKFLHYSTFGSRKWQARKGTSIHVNGIASMEVK